MPDSTRRKRLRSAGDGRYGAFLSVGELLGVRAPRLAHATKVEFLPQWEKDGKTEAVLSKRSLLIDIGVSDVEVADIERTRPLLEALGRAAAEHPERLAR